ncbi:ferrochelatase [Thermohalobacter berrensis]|uniref:Ferrochelatase n=1 Tax=Thermohalobacter berrensis TaxID=99594 RepID=A0A419T9Y2_9FIRM|nr:ferrochelatase [Thermohalobacter berrensis]RKD34289.1 hypothetical protein BET03_00195 [Thermohalobacter berrensis]
MGDIKDIKNEIFYILLFVFFFNLFLAYEDPIENVFLIISYSGLIMIFKNRSKLNTKRRIIFLIIFMLIFYIISVFFLFTQSYNMNLKTSYIGRKSEKTAVLLTYYGEDNMFNMGKRINDLKMDENFINKVKAPFILHKTKRNYEEIGQSDYIKNTIKVKKEVEKRLNENYKVYLGYLKSTKYIEEILINIVNDGYYKIIVVPVFITEGNEFTELKERINNLKLFNQNIYIKWTEPLWDSEKIINSYVEKILFETDINKTSDTGILLIGHGERGYGREEYIEGIKQDLLFRKKIKNYLVNDIKIGKNKIKLAWMNYVEPNYVYEFQRLLEYGVGNIICLYVNPSATNIENYTIAFEIKEEVEIPEGVKVKVVDGFLNDAYFIEELVSRIKFTNLQKWN